MVPKNRKLVRLEIEQMAHPLDTNAHANFFMAENASYQCMEHGGRNMATLTCLWLTVRVGYSVETKSRT